MTKGKTGDKKREIVGGGRTKFKPQIKESSKQYLLRQAKDPWVKKAIKEGYRSRAAYKLKHLQEKYQLIKKGECVVDLGAAPGGWCQVIDEIQSSNGKIIAIDKLYMEPVAGAEIIKGDFNKDEVYEELLALCPNGVDVVLSDMAPETIGHSGADHLRIMQLVELAADFALNTLKPGGHFACKIFQGGEEVGFRDTMRQHFEKVYFEKPEASRKDSKEIFIVCVGFKGA